VIRFYYLVFFVFILVAISLSWDSTQSETQTQLEGLRQDINRLEMQIENTREDLQKEGVLPYEEEKEYWKSYDGDSNLCVEGIEKCV
jgi:hypothetical protein